MAEAFSPKQRPSSECWEDGGRRWTLNWCHALKMWCNGVKFAALTKVTGSGCFIAVQYIHVIVYCIVCYCLMYSIVYCKVQYKIKIQRVKQKFTAQDLLSWNSWMLNLIYIYVYSIYICIYVGDINVKVSAKIAAGWETKQLGVQDVNCSNFNSFLLQNDHVKCPYAYVLMYAI